MQKLRIVYMGTPDFAVESLKALVESGFNIVGVITVPDKPSGRGQQVSESPVKQYAVSKGLKVLQPPRLKDPQFIEELRALNADLQVIVAFRMLPEVVWSMPPLGSVNLHGSLLPQYRGAAPINWAVINGDTFTGVTTFFLKHEIDTGGIIYSEKLAITPEDNAGTVHDKLMVIGANLIVKTVKAISEGNVVVTEQSEIADESTLKHAPKLFKEDGRIDWSSSNISVFNRIRGLSPYPAAWTELINDEGNIYSIKIFETKPVDMPNGKPGDVTTDGKTIFSISTADGELEITDLQLAGKKRMKTSDFLKGFRPGSNLRVR